MHLRRLILAAVLTLAAAGLAVADDKKDDKSTKKYDSPEAVYKAAAAAIKKDDVQALAGCVTTELLEEIAGGMANGGTVLLKFAAAFDKTGKEKEKLKPIADVLKKHGVTEEGIDKALKNAPKVLPKDPRQRYKHMREMAKPIKDKAAFLTDYLGAMDKLGPKDTAPEIGKLEDVKIDKDLATGKVTGKVRKKEVKTEVVFVKEGGGWKMVSLPPAMLQQLYR